MNTSDSVSETSYASAVEEDATPVPVEPLFTNNDNANASMDRKSSSGSAIQESASKKGETSSGRMTASARQRVGGAAKATVETTRRMLHQTEEVVEQNQWCFACRCILRLPKTWPRTMAFFWGVCVPLWILIFLAMGFGARLAKHEGLPELESNDAILAARAQLVYASAEAQLERGQEIGSLIRSCWADLDLSDSENLFLQGTTLEICALSSLPSRPSVLEIASNNTLAFESLSFNWNRCWDKQEFGTQILFQPTDEMIEAVRPESQEEYYKAEWDSQQAYWYDFYRPENATVEEERAAFFQSLEQASGVEACTKNTAGTAWFFFTIMTTVGYGNQAPVTDEGRLLVVTAGLFSVVMFAAVLGVSGFTLLAIVDDFLGRFSFSRFLCNPFVGAIFWGGIWLLYALGTATDVQGWWEARLPEFGAEVSRADALWFAFISTSTIGLGDYFLQPEVIFASDTLKYSVTFMIGFVFLSTFFGKIALCLAFLLPKQQDSLESRLKATRILACWEKGLLPWEKVEELPESSVTQDALAVILDRIRLLEPLLEKSDPAQNNDEDHPTDEVETLETKDSNSKTQLELLHQEKDILRKLVYQVEAKIAQANVLDQISEEEEIMRV